MAILNNDRERKNDLSLIRKAKKGDAKAFAQLVKKYQRQVYYCIARMVFSHHLTDDLIQETFIKVYNNLHRFDESFPFYPWIRCIAVNTTLNRLKHEASKKTYAIAELEPTLVSDHNPIHEVENAEMLRCLRNALHRIPEDQRAVFILRTNEEMSYDEIAATLGISVGTVMSRLNRARSKLKSLLKEHI